MFSANLSVSPELIAAFGNAQELNSSTRAIIVVIVGEQILFKSCISINGDERSDLQTIADSHIGANSASYILFLVSNSSTASTSNSGKSWLCIRWVPETCAVRDKMLYSSSHEDLKRGLGLGFFVDDYVCTSADMLTWESYQETKLKESFTVLSVTEQTIKAESVSYLLKANIM